MQYLTKKNTFDNQKFDLHLVENDFILVFDKQFFPRNNFQLQYNISISHLRKVLLNWFDYFCERSCRFSHTDELNITTIRYTNKKY